MTNTYDWSKLDARWQFDGDDGLIDRKWEIRYSVSALEEDRAITRGSSNPATQLVKCRIPAPDIATVTELRPRDEYDWSRLEGSGWGANPAGFITNGEYRYWYGDAPNQLQVVGHFTRFDASNALVAQQEAARLVAKCKRDWRDEVKQACEGLLGFNVEWYANSAKPRVECVWHHASDSSVVIARAGRTIEVACNTESIEQVLAMSLIIERLKKLGWREA